MDRRISAVVILSALLACGSGASAQQAKAPPTPVAPVSAEPANTSASYGDWVLRCQRVGEGDKMHKICEVAHIIQVQNQPNPVAEVAIGRLPGDPALHLTAVLPASVSFPSSVQLELGDHTHGAEMQWRRCLPGGCFADTSANEDAIKAWRTASAPGRLIFKDAAGREVVMPISFRGFAQALDALGKA